MAAHTLMRRVAPAVVAAATATTALSSGWPPLAPSKGGVERSAEGEVAAVKTALNYQADAVVAVSTRRDAQGSDGALEGAAWDQPVVEIANARPAGATLSQNGFELRRSEAPREVDFYDSASVVEAYYAHCEALVKSATGARKVVAFDHNVRSTRGAGETRLKNGGTVQSPAPIVHGDYTADSAPRRIAQLAQKAKVNDVLDAPLDEADVAASRFAIVNVWRPVSPVKERPLAFCDPASVDLDDLVLFSIHYEDRVGENYFAKYSPRHKWFYFPEMTPDEAVLLKTWDSAVTFDAQKRRQGAQFVLHSAFDDPSSPPDAPPRESIEVRTAVIF